MFNNPKVIEFLLEKDARITARDSDGRSPFLNAVAAGRIDSARVLIEKGADLSVTDLLMKNCIHIAVETENVQMLCLLLDNQVGLSNLYKSDLWDRVPLHYAAKTKDIKVNTSCVCFFF